MQQLAVAIIARDEARHIAEAVRSAMTLTDEVLVLLDDRTHDETAQIAEAGGARVVCEPWRGFPAQRNRALALCNTPWVLFLDADERITPELSAEIQGRLAAPETTAGYRIPRYNLFFGQRLRGGGWYPDYQLRLLDRARAHFDEARQVHEFAELTGPIAELEQHLIHLNIERLDELLHKQRAYAIQEAQTLYRAGRRVRARNFIGAPLREFVRRFVYLHGYRDGLLGLFLCATLAWFEVVKCMHLLGLQRSAAS